MADKLTFFYCIFSAMNDLIDTAQEEVVYLICSFCERLQNDSLVSRFLDGASADGLSRIRCFLQGAICSWIGVINDITRGNPSSTTIDEGRLALLWGIIRCYPHMMDLRESSSLLMDLVDALNCLLMIGSGEFCIQVQFGNLSTSCWVNIYLQE